MELIRYISDLVEFGQTIYLDLTKGIPEEFTLSNMDVIKVPKKVYHKPLVYFQGVVGTGANGTQVAKKIPLLITEGERLSFATRRIQDQLTLVWIWKMYCLPGQAWKSLWRSSCRNCFLWAIPPPTRCCRKGIFSWCPSGSAMYM